MSLAKSAWRRWPSGSDTSYECRASGTRECRVTARADRCWACSAIGRAGAIGALAEIGVTLESAIADNDDQVDAQRMSEDCLHWLMQWYLDQCDDDWEHSYGVSIGTLDNPGWTLTIDLQATGLEDQPFLPVQIGEIASNLEDWHKSGSWYSAKVEDGKFEGACGPTDLPALIQAFRQWVERTGS